MFDDPWDLPGPAVPGGQQVGKLVEFFGEDEDEAAAVDVNEAVQRGVENGDWRIVEKLVKTRADLDTDGTDEEAEVEV